MAYESVLDREMFRPKSRGVEELREPEDNGDVKLRREQAGAMIEAAKQKFDPANFQTLTEQERPQVFRPVAVNMPAQQQTATTAQRMQQMGMRPIGMAEGGDPADKVEPTIESPGIFERFSRWMYPDGPQTMAVGPNAKYSLPDVGLRIGKEDQPGITGLPKAGELSPGREPPEALSPEGKISQKPIAELTDDEVEQLADYIYSLDAAKFKETVAKTPAGRGLQSLNIFRREPDREEIKKDLIEKRSSAREFKGMEERSAAEQERERQRGEVMRTEKVPSIFSEVSPEEYDAKMKAREDALRKINETAPEAASTSTPEGIANLIGSGRGAVERPGERQAYLNALIEKNRASGGGTPDETKKPEDTEKAGGPDKDHPTSLYDIKRDREEAFNMALMQAGLAMMAGKSSNALVNIGEGGVYGLKAYSDAMKSARENALVERKIKAYEESLTRQEEYDKARMEALTAKATATSQGLAAKAAQLAAERLKAEADMDPALKMDQSKRDNRYRVLYQNALKDFQLDYNAGLIGGDSGLEKVQPSNTMSKMFPE